MKRNLMSFLILWVFVGACGTSTDGITGATEINNSGGNSLYHRTEETPLKVGELFVGGEVQNPGKVDLRKYYQREVFSKQARSVAPDSVDFQGAYRFRGYSLFDLLNHFLVAKKNAEDFHPATDLYVVIENDKGQKVSFSWSEIFYTQQPHQIIIATHSAPIEPFKKEVNYPTGTQWKVIAANDLYDFRTLKNPIKITVKSFDKNDYVVNRKLKNPVSPGFALIINNQKVATFDSTTAYPCHQEYNSVFYGMGMGYHPIPNFRGVELSSFVQLLMPKEMDPLMTNGLVCFSATDGYRAVVSFAELFNRADQVHPLLAIPPKDSGSGYFRFYQPSCFYADMSVRNLSEMYVFID